MDILKTATFNVKLKNGKYLIEENGITYDRAQMLCNKAMTENKDDEVFCDQMAASMNSFGFRGFGGGDISIKIDAYIPVVATAEKHTCPRRIEGPWAGDVGIDIWNMIGEDKCCSYCGSLHPDRVIELIKELGSSIYGSTTKSYKGYITRDNVPNAGFGGTKFYVQHFDKIQLDKLNMLLFGKTE